MAAIVIIKTEIYNITSENAVEKLKPHFDEVTHDLLLHKLSHVKVITRIEKLSETKVQMVTDILDIS